MARLSTAEPDVVADDSGHRDRMKGLCGTDRLPVTSLIKPAADRSSTALRRTTGLGLIGTALLMAGAAHAGPPYRTDDPEPVEYQHLESYTFTTGSHISGDTAGVAPGAEFNYGVVPNGQAHIAVPAATFDSPTGGPTVFGLGDVELGFKYRLIDEDKGGARPQIGLYPLVELPTGSAARSLGAGYTRFFLPLWVQKSFGDWTTFGGGGYWFNQNDQAGGRNYWFFGWTLQRRITDKLAIGAELFHQTATSTPAANPAGFNVATVDTTGFNVGVVYDIDEHDHLLLSAGRGLQNAAQTNLYSWYLGWQFTY